MFRVSMLRLATVGLLAFSHTFVNPPVQSEELSVWDYSESIMDESTNIRVGNHKFTDLERFQLSKGCLSEAGLEDFNATELDRLTGRSYSFKLYDTCIQVNTKNKPPKWIHTCPYRACTFTENPYRTFYPE